ncbi:MAG: type II toxin-antitoxin system HipA family toxin [Rhodothermaceae bacterium]|nr:type II toxin-antitoxin system HipA family toxin [Rhodothermaceae bacterium]MYD20530.1 type II toxin-antitoxin system HipA family toxin [Rhodothermaceae bacterium]MYD56111.1 type II toxin-antitoxin system HipA family toxin [Rhodothermaceae bacterium]
MATNLWGKVYYGDTFAGILAQEAGGRCVFAYDESYLQSSLPAISYTLPLRAEPHLSEYGLHPFFDNLCAEGWLKDVQARALALRTDDRFPLLLAFGTDLAGSVSIIDPDPVGDIKIDHNDPDNIAALSARASLSGVQPKLGAIKEGRVFRPVRRGERATYIAKLPSPMLPDILGLEYITTRACAALLKEDMVADMTLAPLQGVSERALFIKRFDRTEDGRKTHFEEFNQLLGNRSEDKYEACYEHMADFIIQNGEICLRAECDTLFRRVMACILTGNTDAHLKNFAMEHTESGLRLAPCYDLVATACYPQYQTLALGIGGAKNMRIGSIGPKKIARLGNLFGLPDRAVMLAVSDFASRLNRAHSTVDASKKVDQYIKDKLHQQLEKRWNGAFDSIGTYLSKKR